MGGARLFSRPLGRSLAATLGVLLTAVLTTAGMAAYLPLNQANQVVLPIILFPVTWLVLFLWVLLDQRLWRPLLGLLVLSVGHLLLILANIGRL
ncbi:MAG: hypothetical protein AAFY29_16455 [Pseudomonadota bacterium]